MYLLEVSVMFLIFKGLMCWHIAHEKATTATMPNKIDTDIIIPLIKYFKHSGTFSLK